MAPNRPRLPRAALAAREWVSTAGWHRASVGAILGHSRAIHGPYGPCQNRPESARIATWNDTRRHEKHETTRNSRTRVRTESAETTMAGIVEHAFERPARSRCLASARGIARGRGSPRVAAGRSRVARGSPRDRSRRGSPRDRSRRGSLAGRRGIARGSPRDRSRRGSPRVAAGRRGIARGTIGAASYYAKGAATIASARDREQPATVEHVFDSNRCSTRGTRTRVRPPA